MQVSIRLFSAGYCVQSKSLAIRGAKDEQVKFHAIFALLEHPKAGYILFDTGYSSRFFEETRRFPFNLYAFITPVYFKDEDGVVAQLNKLGISPLEIKQIVLSHFHPDHVGSIKDFSNAEFLCLKSAYEDIKGEQGFAALRKAFLPGLLPGDFNNRVKFVDELLAVDVSERYAPFEKAYDLMGDGSMLAIELPGHAQGQIGLMLQTADGTHFLVADACWLSESYRKNLLPHPLAGLMFPDRRAYRVTLEKIHQLHQRNPSLKIIPSHCQEVWEDLIMGACHT